MKKYLKESIILLIQLVIFYVFPLFTISLDAMGMVFILIFVTFLLSIIIGSISSQKIKYFYPLIVSFLFLPSVFIYYNNSALVHSIWYLFASFIGLVIGSILYKINNQRRYL